MRSSVLSLIYEPIQVRHAAELYDELLDERLYRYTPDGPPRSLAALEREYAEFSGGAPAETGEIWLNWIVRDPISSSCIGTLQATCFADGLLWVGYKVVPKAWGAGVATSALRWLVRELNRVFEGQSLHAAVDTRNASSIRVLHKCDFVLLRNEPAELRGEPTEDHIYLFSPHK